MRSRGITLVEMLVVSSIVAFLALLIFSMTRAQLFKGHDARRKSDIERIRIAIEEYEKDYDCYPLPQLVVCNPGTGLQPYLDRVPCDPISSDSYLYEHEEDQCPSWYRLYARLENNSDPDISKLGCQDGCGPDRAFNYYSASPNAPPAGAGDAE